MKLRDSVGILTVCFLMATTLLASESDVLSGERQINFQRDIRPILSANCFQCHGPDENTREAGLRLDVAAQAYEDRGGYAVLVPGNSKESELLRRVRTDDHDELMPPPDSGKQLSAEQIELLQSWIVGGANYQQHWAFVKPQRAVLPKVQNDSWPRNEIDYFVLNRMEREGLSPASQADRYQLIRRVYLDLIGLPPTVEQADEFVFDERADAYERLVDRLLASPHYGERWARRWLDLARYSDTKGYEKDQPRTMWLYRDWVINALNEGMPFDQFTIEQIAGDMLPEPTLNQRIATGFHRNTMTNEEGGIDPQEFRYHAIVDRVATTGTTWLGLTVGCAQCHTHKFDPITHTDYYQLFAFLNNADELKIEVPKPKVTEQRRRVEGEISAAVADLQHHFPIDEGSDSSESTPQEVSDEQRELVVEQAFSRWKEDQRQRVVHWRPLRPRHVDSNLPTTTVLQDDSVLCSGDVTKNDVFEVAFDIGAVPITAIRLEALPHPSLPGTGPGRQTIVENGQREGNFYLSEVDAWIADINDPTKKIASIAWKQATASFVPPGLSAQHAIDGKHDTGWTVRRAEGERHTLVLQLIGPVTFAHDQVLKIRLQHENFYPAGLGRFRISATSAPGEIKATGLTDEVAAALLAEEHELTRDQQASLRQHFLLTAPALKSQHEHIAKLKKELPDYPTALVMQQRSEQHQRQTFRHHRGEFLQPKEPVQAGVIDALHELSNGGTADRLDFAKWLVSTENPLVARVVMNRHWEAIFGRGLVITSEDFGYQSEFPTHPKLLDWLAVEFMDRGWSLKQMHKLIVTSATYRQSPTATPELLSRDPQNKLLARGSRFRVESELVRDIILQASGLLSSKMGGPSVFPAQPPGITEAAYGPLNWSISEGEDRYRRGLYTFNKRTAPYAAFGLFDAPSGEVCVPRRNRSNTPLQSLAMLNDEVVLEAARELATGCLDIFGTDDESLAIELFRRCVTRPPKDDELLTILSYYRQQLQRFRSGGANPYPVLQTGPDTVWSFADGPAGWVARNQTDFQIEDGRLRVVCEGSDPFISVDCTSPAGPHTLKIRAWFSEQGTGQVFWTTASASNESPDRKTDFEIFPDKWHDYNIRFETADDLRSLRIDTGERPGTVDFEHIELNYGDGHYEISSNLDVNQLAAWMLTARALLNLDETITKP